MKKSMPFVFFLFLLSQGTFAQSLVGTWVSDQPLLTMVRFSLTFHSDMTYRIDCTLGQATGTFVSTDDKITFTPIASGINAGSMGDTHVYAYTFMDENTFSLDAHGTKVKLIRLKIPPKA